MYTREFVSHSLSLVCTHTRTRRGGWVERQRDRGAEELREWVAEGQRDWGAEGLNGIMLDIFIIYTSAHPCS